MNQEYRLDREYSIAEIIQCNLRKWWLALICAAVCAAVLGGYKYKSLKPFIEQSVYENVKQVTATLYVADYSTSASTERANNVIKMAQSYRAYELVQQKTGCDLDYKTYQGIFDVLQGEAGDMVTIYRSTLIPERSASPMRTAPLHLHRRSLMRHFRWAVSSRAGRPALPCWTHRIRTARPEKRRITLSLRTISRAA